LKILLDQNVPRPLVRFLGVHPVTRASELGWSELKNGALLTAAERARFDVLLSGDKTIQHEQNMAGRKIALVYMSDNHWPLVKDHVAAIVEALDGALPGTVTAVDCGAFVPRRFRKPPGPFS
jgi:hypothetical protein